MIDLLFMPFFRRHPSGFISTRSPTPLAPSCARWQCEAAELVADQSSQS